MPPHCDTMDGPVVKAAKLAMEKGNVNLILSWLPKKGDEFCKHYWIELEQMKDLINYLNLS
jgi:hypothetical protein